MTSFADAAIPGVTLAQGIGRWGNWFNNELYGGPTSLPWRLQIHCMDLIQGHAQPCSGIPGTSTTLGYFQPTFLYESLWDLALAFALIYADRRWRLGRGNLFALYAMGYTLGRGWIEALRSDYAHHILGLRLNDWVSILVFVGGLAWFLRHGGLRGGREPSVYARDRAADGSPDVEDPSTASPGRHDDRR
jgi:prolipoprotein diacylglyceryl transferase